VIIKLLEGTQGIGVILADNTKVAEAIIETLQTTKQNVLIQSFVKESKGKDVRAFVVGGRVVAAMRRKAKGDEFRSNVHRGASVEAIKLDGEYESTAIRAAQVLGLHVAGVDMLEGKDGPMVMEVNSSPGLEGIERATHVDVGDAIVQYIEQQVLFPDVDIRQKLTLQKEYGVAEFQLSRDSVLCGKMLKDSGLREKDILVLNIQRGTLNIPNPRSTRQLLANDVLLCFGSLLAMRSLVHVGVVPHKLDTPVPTTRGGRKRKSPAAA
jgi:ribosomal protein S6--L-glutamate ligase